MKTFLTFAVFSLLIASILTDEVVKKDDNEAKVYKRLIPADVLRGKFIILTKKSLYVIKYNILTDFPGMCFASTRCATVEPGKTWELSPFCGRSTCVVSEDQPPKLLELVEDCGPLPLPNDKCQLNTDKTNKTASFPACCPIFKCEPGVKLEYPEVKPADEKKN